MATIPTAKPRTKKTDIEELVNRADPGQQSRPEVEYEFSNGRKMIKRPGTEYP